MKQVAAAIIFNQNKEVLICQRCDGGSCSDLWEFPGGKRELNETLEACAIRECKEELDADIKILSLYEETAYVYPEYEVQLTFYLAELLNEEIKMLVHQKICWVPLSRLGDYEFCPGNNELIKRLRSEAESN